MTQSRRDVLATLMGTGAGLAFPVAAQAQAWPARPLTFIHGAAAGSTVDLVARVVGEQLSVRLARPVVIESRPGGSFNIATQAMLGAPADGYTLGLAPITMSTNPALMNVGYDPLRDVTMVTQISSLPVVVVVGRHRPWRTLAEMVDHARRRPGDISLGHGGHGTSGFLAAQIFGRASGSEFLMVAYRGTAPVLTDMLAGTVDGTFTPVDPTLRGHVESGAMRILGVMQATRIALLPDVPTTREQGFGPEVDFRSWHGLMVRAGTPEPIVDRLFAETTAIARDPAVAQRLLQSGIEVAPSASRAEFVAFYESELARMTKLIRDLGIQPQ